MCLSEKSFSGGLMGAREGLLEEALGSSLSEEAVWVWSPGLLNAQKLPVISSHSLERQVRAATARLQLRQL